MGIKLDFGIIIAVLVMLQLYVLGMDARKAGKNKNRIKPENEETMETTAEGVEVSLTVHRSNGEEKVYTKSNVA